MPAIDQRMAQAGHQVLLPSARRAEQEQIASLFDPAVGFGQRLICALETVGTAAKSKLESNSRAAV
jgi:hypothetical protein